MGVTRRSYLHLGIFEGVSVVVDVAVVVVDVVVDVVVVVDDVVVVVDDVVVDDGEAPTFQATSEP